MSLQTKRDFWLIATILSLFPAMVLFFVGAVASWEWWQQAAAANPGQLVGQAVAWIRKYWLFVCLANLLTAASLVSYRQYARCLKQIDAHQR
jgi:hypothetical protein